MSYIYNALKPHLYKDVIGMIEDMVKWQGDIKTILDDKNSYCHGGKITIKDYQPKIQILLEKNHLQLIKLVGVFHRMLCLTNQYLLNIFSKESNVIVQ